MELQKSLMNMNVVMCNYFKVILLFSIVVRICVLSQQRFVIMLLDISTEHTKIAKLYLLKPKFT